MVTFSPKVWCDVLRRLQEEIPDFKFEAWIAPLAVKVANDHVLLGCPSSFHRDRVRNYYGDSIRACLQADGGSAISTVEFLTMSEFNTASGLVVDVLRPEKQVHSAMPVGGGGPMAAVAEVEPLALPELLAGDDIDQDGMPSGHPRTHGASTPVLHSVPVPPRSKRAVKTNTTSSRGKREPLSPTGSAQPELPFSFESFVVGPCNALAREAALALARRRQRSLNQLYLGGESGMGKTHLARAAAAEARRHEAPLHTAGTGPPGARSRRESGSPALNPKVVFTSADKFTSEFVSAMRLGQSEEWQRRYRGQIGLLIVEDVQFLRGREKTQLELFHTVQHVLDAGGNVLMTGDRPPRDLVGLDERMRDQLGRGFVAELERPDALVRRHILRSKAAAGGIHLPADCLETLVEASAGSVRDIESMLIQVVTTASLMGRSIDFDLTQAAIALKSGAASTIQPKTLAVGEIVRIVAAFFGKRPEALAARSRRRDVLVPRQLAMYLAHRYTDASFAEIGQALARDRPSVANAMIRIERLVLENAPIRYQVEALSERIDQTLKQARTQGHTDSATSAD